MIFHKIFLLILFLFILGCSASKINKSHGTVGIEDKYRVYLSKKTFNYFTKDVINHKF